MWGKQQAGRRPCTYNFICLCVYDTCMWHYPCLSPACLLHGLTLTPNPQLKYTACSHCSDLAGACVGGLRREGNAECIISLHGNAPHAKVPVWHLAPASWPFAKTAFWNVQQNVFLLAWQEVTAQHAYGFLSKPRLPTYIRFEQKRELWETSQVQCPDVLSWLELRHSCEQMEEIITREQQARQVHLKFRAPWAPNYRDV